MMIPEMYVNPAIVSMVIALMLALVTVGGIVWRLSDRISGIAADVRVLGAKLEGHIEFCERQNAATRKISSSR